VVLHDIEVMQTLDLTISATQAGLDAATRDAGQVSIVAYALHNLYNALENSFEQISATFENHITRRDQWHSELLMKMSLKMPEIRPAVLTARARNTANELLKFRHLYRHAYEMELDPEKLHIIVRKWLDGREEIFSSLQDFCAWLRQGSDRKE